MSEISYGSDCIAAVATAAVPSGVAVIRISGKNALNVVRDMCPSVAEVKPRYAHFCKFQNAEGITLDEGILLYFPAPHSFTGEEVIEIQCHGGRAVVQSLLDEIFNRGARQAEAGEFTKRAVLNGKMDLTAAEGLADLIAAETTAQQVQAVRQLGGELGEMFDGWRHEILQLMAQVEAAIDFPDEELEVLQEAALEKRISAMINQLEKAVATKAGQRLRDGFRVAIIGKPNAGKSTLTNLLTGRETAIVSPIAGTTRDVVEAHLNIGGYPVILADTAGMRITEDEIEAEGVKRASGQAKEADLVIAVVGADEFPSLDAGVAEFVNDNSLIVVSKADQHEVKGEVEVGAAKIALNLKDKDTALPTILAELEKLVEKSFAPARESALITRNRHRQAIEDSLNHLNNAARMLADRLNGIEVLSELMAQDLRDAAEALAKVTGAISNDDVLDVVFSEFCIGK